MYLNYMGLCVIMLLPFFCIYADVAWKINLTKVAKEYGTEGRAEKILNSS